MLEINVTLQIKFHTDELIIFYLLQPCLLTLKCHTDTLISCLNGCLYLLLGNLLNWHVCRKSCPMLNPVPKSIHFLDYLHFGALFNFFPLVNLLELVQLALVICLLFNWPNYINQLAKFV